MEIFGDFYISCSPIFLHDRPSFNHTSANFENKKKQIFSMSLHAKLQERTIFPNPVSQNFPEFLKA